MLSDDPAFNFSPSWMITPSIIVAHSSICTLQYFRVTFDILFFPSFPLLFPLFPHLFFSDLFPSLTLLIFARRGMPRTQLRFMASPMAQIIRRTRFSSSCVRCTQAYQISTIFPIYTCLGLKSVASSFTFASMTFELQHLSSFQKDVVFATSSPDIPADPPTGAWIGRLCHVTSTCSVLA